MLLLALVLACGSPPEPTSVPPSTREAAPAAAAALREGAPRAPGDLAPDGELPRLDAPGRLALSDLLEQDGTRAVLAVFVAAWCDVCARALPELEHLRRQNPGLELLVFSTDANAAERRKLLDKMDRVGVRAPTVMGPPRTQAAWLGAQHALPQFFFVDDSGHIVAHEVGFDDEVRGRLSSSARAALSSAP